MSGRRENERGLAAREMVIIEGLQKIGDGDPVKIAPIEPDGKN